MIGPEQAMKQLPVDLLQEWFEITREMSQDLAAALENDYAGTQGNPAMSRRYTRDLEIVVRAENLLARIGQI